MYSIQFLKFSVWLKLQIFSIEREGGSLKLLSMEVVYGICLYIIRTISLFIFPIENIFIYIDLNLKN